MVNTSSLDTNAIIYLLVGTEPRLQNKVIELLSDRSQTFLVEDVTIIEVVHVLENYYQFKRGEVVQYIAMLLSIVNISVSKIFYRVAKVYQEHPKLSFVDCYLACVAEEKSAEPLFTFDKKLAKQLPSAKEIR